VFLFLFRIVLGGDKGNERQQNRHKDRQMAKAFIFHEILSFLFRLLQEAV
jgi:hypothetical protein